MTHSFTRRGPKAWGSYVCDRVQKSGARACPGSRIAVGTIETAVVDRIRVFARDPVLVAATVDAARRELDARRTELAAEIERHDGERRRIERERENLLDAIAKGGGPALTTRLTAIEAEHAGVVVRVSDRQAELSEVTARVIDADEVAAALAEFDGIWGALEPRERTRLLGILIRQVSYDGRSGMVEIDFRTTKAAEREGVA